MSYRDIHVSEVGELLDREEVVVIDMRDSHAQSQGQLPKAQPASDAVINGLVRKRRSNPPVLVYCYHGNQSRDLCNFLIQLGLSEVYNLEGGWEAWANLAQPPAALSETHKDWLRAQGFDPDNLNSRVELGMSPLMLAALRGERELVNSLLAASADPKQVNDDEHHALWFACVNGDIELVTTLIAAGSDLDNRNVNGVTCAMYAASTGKLELLQTLVEAGADLSIRTPDGINALESSSTLPVLRYLKPLIRKAG